MRVSKTLELALLWVCRKFLHSQLVAKVIKVNYWFSMKNHLIYKERQILLHATVPCVHWFLSFFSLKSSVLSHSLSFSLTLCFLLRIDRFSIIPFSFLTVRSTSVTSSFITHSVSHLKEIHRQTLQAE